MRTAVNALLFVTVCAMAGVAGWLLGVLLIRIAEL